MKQRFKNSFLIVYVFCFGFLSCVTPFEIAPEENIDSRLVVEGLLTDELKFQEIKLTRTYLLEKWTPVTIEKNATVRVVEDGTVFYDYVENEPGKYVSKIKFKANTNKTYKLEILLSTGKKYASKTQMLPNELTSDFDVVAKKEIDKEGREGVMLSYVNTNGGQSDASSYYRFDYSNTYKIVSPNWSDEELIVNSTILPTMSFKNHENGKICYGNDVSTKYILRNANEFQGNAVESFNLNFLLKDNHKIFYRYSIKVNQYVISREAHTYYNTLKDFSESENVFSENQPGNIIGNIVSLDDNSENVIGFFDVTKILSKRIFFNYTDFFLKSGQLAEDFFFVPCVKSFPTLRSQGLKQPLSLNDMLIKQVVVFLAENNDNPGGPFQVVTKKCGDCSSLGDIIKPDFWKE